jgi:hypothetical protein
VREVLLATIRARGVRATALTYTLVLLALGVVVLVLGRNSRALPLVCCLYAVMVANGLIGEDVRDGSVGLLLARPLTRSRYLAGRLLGACLLTAAFCVLLLAVCAAALRPAPDAFVMVTGAALAAGLWTVCVIFFFSTFLPGRADALCALALWLSAGSLNMARGEIERPWLKHAVEWLWDNVTSTVVVMGLPLGPASVTDLLRWASNVTLLLLAGFLVFNHRQFGYAD